MSKPGQGWVAKKWVVVALLASSSAPGSTAHAQPPSAAMGFEPTPIGQRTISTLTMTFTNPDPAVPAADLAVTNNLPPGLRIATPSQASTTCTNAVLTAPDGATTFTLSGGRIGASQTCALQVDVTGDLAGSYANVSGDVTSSAGNGGPAEADLTISADLPIFEMSFAPSSVPLGGTSTITYTIENPASAPLRQSLSFLNALPPGLAVATPANTSSTCNPGSAGPALTAQPGATQVSFFSSLLNSGTSCTASVDVTASAAGELGNTTEPLLFFNPTGSTGKAGAVLEATVEQLNLAGFFSGDPVPPGGTLDLDFTISNFSRAHEATSISFTNDLDATLSGLVALGLPVTGVCGAGSNLSGTDTITLTGGSLPPEGSCSFSVQAQVPSNAPPGIYINASSAVTADIDGRSVTGGQAVDSFEVSEAPTLAMQFIPDTVPAGQSTALEYIITNVSASNAVSDIAFVDNLTQFIPGTVATVPDPGFCGAGSMLAFSFIATDELGLVMTGGSLPAGGSCTFQATLDFPLTVAAGSYVNATQPITATVDGNAVAGKPAEAGLTFLAAPQLRKSFSEARVAPGDEVTLQFELSYGEGAPDEATDIAFDDDLEAMIPGLVATDLPKNDVCGTGSSLSGTSLLTFTGGTLAPNETCAFDATVTVPDDTPTGQYNNTTSGLSALVSEEIVVGEAAFADLEVTSVVLDKLFVEDPGFADDEVTLRFTITNSSATDDASNMFFTDSLSAVLPGLAATGLPLLGICGAGSRIEGTNFLIFTSGNLAAGSSCSFDVTLQVPASAPPGSYSNVTSSLSFELGDPPVAAIIAGATARLTISEPLTFAKAFDADAVAPGETVSLEFTIDNAHTSYSADELTFTDDLGAALEGLEALGLPISDVCGAGSMLSGTDVITLTGGTIAPESSCTFSVELQVPSDVTSGTTVSNVSSELSGLVNGIARTAPPARDELEVTLMTLSKSFEDDLEVGSSTTLTFVIENLNGDSTATGVGFTDDLDAVLEGLTATGTPIEDACGPGSVLDGSSVLTLRGGNVDAGGSCTFDVTVGVPSGAAPGEYENVTSELSSDLGVAGDPATATLTVVPAVIPDGGVDAGPDAGPDGGTGDTGGGGCGCRTASVKDTPTWLLALVLFVAWRRKLRR